MEEHNFEDLQVQGKLTPQESLEKHLEFVDDVLGEVRHATERLAETFDSVPTTPFESSDAVQKQVQEPLADSNEFAELELHTRSDGIRDTGERQEVHADVEEARSHAQNLEEVEVQYLPLADWKEIKEVLVSIERKVATICAPSSKEVKTTRAPMKKNKGAKDKNKLATDMERKRLFSYLDAEFGDILDTIKTIEVVSAETLQEMKEMLASRAKGKQVEQQFAEDEEKKDVTRQIQLNERSGSVYSDVYEAGNIAVQTISPNTQKRKATWDPPTPFCYLNDGLRNFSEELGVTAEDPVVVALEELGKLGSFGRSQAVEHLWNRKTGRGATLAESLEFILSEVRMKRKKSDNRVAHLVEYCNERLKEVRKAFGEMLVDSLTVALRQLEKFYPYPFGRSPAVERFWNRSARRVGTLVESLEYVFSQCKPIYKKRKFNHDVLITYP